MRIFKRIFLVIFLFMLSSVRMAYAEKPLTPVDYYEKALKSFPDDQKEATVLATKARLYAMYDIARVADTSAHEAWSVLKQNLEPIYQWALYHPKAYQEILQDTIKWAKSAPPPDYRPDWMINHGMVAMQSAMQGKEAPDPFVPNDDQQADWNKAIDSIQKFLDDRNTWVKFEHDIEPANAYNALKERIENRIERNSTYLSSENLKKLKNVLNQILESYNTRTGTVEDRMMSVMDEVDKFIASHMDDESFLSAKERDVANNDNFAKATLRSVSSAVEGFASDHGGKYPTDMKQLTEGKSPYLTSDFCDQSQGGFKYTCQLDEKGYIFKATPERLGETGSKIFVITTGGVLNS